MEPTITVLMPVYNEEARYLRKSIESILHQTFRFFEFLIIDDGSDNENCVNILKEYAVKDGRIRIIHRGRPKNIVGNTGITGALNLGLKEARGKYLARIDSDDFADNKRLEIQYEFLENNPDFVLCGTWCRIVDSDDNVIGEKRGYSDYNKIKKNILSTNYFTHSTLFFKKSVILDLGGYNKKMIKAQDYDLLLKIASRYKIKNISQFLSYYRINNRSISFSNNKLQEKYALIARLNALRFYKYPKIYCLKLIRPLVFYLFVPLFIKKLLMKLLWKI